MVALAGLLWSLSAALGAWLWAPCGASLAGAIFGCAAASLLAARGGARRLPVAALVTVTLAAGALIVDHWGAPLPDAATSVLAFEGLLSGLFAFVIVGLFQSARHPLLPLVECAVFASPWVLLLAGHRGGHLDRPVNLVEPAWAAGFDPFRLFATIGLLLGVLLVLLLAARRSRRLNWPGLMFLLLAAILWALLIPVEKLSRGPGSEVAEQTSAEAPAASKPDTPLAVVVLFHDYDPELGIYHLRAQEGAPRPVGAEQVGEPLHYRVAEMVPQSEPLVLGWQPEMLPADSANKGSFARLYEVKSRVQTRPLAELLDLPLAAPAQPPPSPYSKLAAEIVPESERAQPLRAALRVKLWMEQNRAQSEDQEPDSGSTDLCLRENAAVGQKTYTQACQKLLEALGLETRLVQGFAVRADQKGEGSYLLISDSNARFWLELDLAGAGPVVVDLYPLQGPSDSGGPQNRELQHQLGEMARAKGTSNQPLPGLSAGALGFILFLLILATGGYAIKAYRRLRVAWCARSRLPTWGMIAVLDRLAEVGEVRRTGETRLEFARRLKERVPSLEALTHLHQKASLGDPRGPSHDNAKPLVLAALAECARSHSLSRRVAGWLHPFAWMKVL